MSKKKKVVVLTGAGISAESGISTFRDAGGLWEGYDVMEVASPEGWAKNPALVLDFYNQRRRQLKEVEPNAAHRALVRLEPHYDTVIVTQNVDDLHERAGSSRIIHLHGELKKVRSTTDPSLVYHWEDDLHLGDTCEKGSQLRPHIVWFGEDVPETSLQFGHAEAMPSATSPTRSRSAPSLAMARALATARRDDAPWAITTTPSTPTRWAPPVSS